MISLRLILLTILQFCYFYSFGQVTSNLNSKFTVVIDAGHGGKDPGNTGNGFIEKDIALRISLRLGKKLEEKDINVIYTRKKDVFIGLFERANIANRSDAQLFISIHCDSFHTSQPYGAGTFVLGLHANERNFEIAKKENSVIFYEDDYENTYDGFDPNNPESVIGLTLMQEEYLDQSIIAASYIQNSFVNSLKRRNRDVKQAGFAVLRYTYMPSVLVETGFLTNRNEGLYLNSSKGQAEMADAISMEMGAPTDWSTDVQTASGQSHLEDFILMERVSVPEFLLYQGDQSFPFLTDEWPALQFYLSLLPRGLGSRGIAYLLFV